MRFFGSTVPAFAQVCADCHGISCIGTGSHDYAITVSNASAAKRHIARSHRARLLGVGADAVTAARQFAQQMYSADVASQALGITIEGISPGQATARLRITDSMINGHAIAHGGFVFLLADTAFAFACNTYGRRAVAREATITFLNPVQAGEHLLAIATERHREGRNGIYDVSVRRADGAVVAEFRGHSRELEG